MADGKSINEMNKRELAKLILQLKDEKAKLRDERAVFESRSHSLKNEVDVLDRKYRETAGKVSDLLGEIEELQKVILSQANEFAHARIAIARLEGRDK